MSEIEPLPAGTKADDKDLNRKELVMYSSILIGSAIILVAVMVHDSTSLEARSQLITAYNNLSAQCYDLQYRCVSQCGYSHPVKIKNYSEIFNLTGDAP